MLMIDPTMLDFKLTPKMIGDDELLIPYAAIRYAIATLPDFATIDLVRCRDCVNYRFGECTIDPFLKHNEDDFCSRAVAKRR